MRNLIFISASLFAHGTAGVCLWTTVHWGSMHMGIQKGDNGASIVIVSPGELNRGKLSKKEIQSPSEAIYKDNLEPSSGTGARALKKRTDGHSLELREDMSDFVRPTSMHEKDTLPAAPEMKTPKNSGKGKREEISSVNPSLGAAEEVESKQNAVCIVIPGRQIGVETLADNSSVNPAPRYPKIAILKGWEGETVLRVSVNSRGKVDHVEIIQPSGHDVLDNAALETLKLWQFEKGKPKYLEIPIRFILKNAAA